MIAKEYGIYLQEDDQLFDLYYLSGAAIKQHQEKVEAYQNNKVYI